LGSDRVDYSLRIKEANKVFIEAKHTGKKLEDEIIQEQLLKYSFKSGVELAILSNGYSWLFFLPLIPQKDWTDRRFFSVHIPQQPSEDITDNFIKFLSRERVDSGEALKSAKKTYESQSRVKTLSETVPKAWNEILSELLEKEEESYLYDLISEETERLCGFKPSFGVIGDFIEQNKNRLFIGEDVYFEKVIPKPTKSKLPKTYTGTSNVRLGNCCGVQIGRKRS